MIAVFFLAFLRSTSGGTDSDLEDNDIAGMVERADEIQSDEEVVQDPMMMNAESESTADPPEIDLASSGQGISTEVDTADEMREPDSKKKKAAPKKRWDRYSKETKAACLKCRSIIDNQGPAARREFFARGTIWYPPEPTTHGMNSAFCAGAFTVPPIMFWDPPSIWPNLVPTCPCPHCGKPDHVSKTGAKWTIPGKVIRHDAHVFARHKNIQMRRVQQVVSMHAPRIG